MKLKDRYAQLSKEGRAKLAEDAGTSEAYLWQMASGWVRAGRDKPVRPSIELMQRLVAADSKLTLQELVDEFAQPSKEVA